MKTYRQFAIVLIMVATFFIHRNAMAAWTNVFVDDFQQFSAGTSLAPLFYTPTAGYRTDVFTNKVGSSAMATNVGGNMKALFNVGVSNNLTYFARLGFNTGTSSNVVAYSNIGTRVSFDLQVANTNGGLGATLISLTDTNSTYLTNSETALLGIFDTGLIGIFTNGPGASTFVTIGSFSPGVSYTYMIDWNLFLDVYSISQNGIYLTNNVPIPGFLNTTFLDSVGIKFAENINVGNQFVLDNVIVAIPEPSLAMILGLGLAAVAFLRRRRA
ncbi:MAG: PEP-CTERM sorting domain-containing protein [Terrimicrobiaceae bacterium]